MTAFSWTTKQSDPLLRRIRSNIVIGFLGVIAKIIETASNIGSFSFRHRVAPTTGLEIRTQMVSSSIFGLLRNDTETDKVKIQSIISTFPLFKKESIQKSFTQDEFAGIEKIDAQQEKINKLKIFIEKFPGVKTGKDFLELCQIKKELNTEIVRINEQLEELQAAKAKGEEVDASIEERLLQELSEYNPLAENLKALNGLEFEIGENLYDASNLVFSPMGDSIALLQYVKSRNEDSTEFTYNWLKDQPDCEEKTRLIDLITETEFNPQKQLAKLELEKQAIEAFNAFKTEKKLKALSLENIIQFEKEDPGKRHTFARVLEKMALNQVIDQYIADSFRRDDVEIKFGDVKFTSLQKILFENPDDPRLRYVKMTICKQITQLRDYICKSSGIDDDEAMAKIGALLWATTQAFERVEIVPDINTFLAIIADFSRLASDHRLALSTSLGTIYTSGPSNYQSPERDRYKYTLNKDGSFSSEVEKTSWAFVLGPDSGSQQRKEYYLPTRLKIEGQFDGTTLKETIYSSGIDSDKIFIRS